MAGGGWERGRRQSPEHIARRQLSTLRKKLERENRPPEPWEQTRLERLCEQLGIDPKEEGIPSCRIAEVGQKENVPPGGAAQEEKPAGGKPTLKEKNTEKVLRYFRTEVKGEPRYFKARDIGKALGLSSKHVSDVLIQLRDIPVEDLEIASYAKGKGYHMWRVAPTPPPVEAPPGPPSLPVESGRDEGCPECEENQDYCGDCDGTWQACSECPDRHDPHLIEDPKFSMDTPSVEYQKVEPGAPGVMDVVELQQRYRFPQEQIGTPGPDLEDRLTRQMEEEVRAAISLLQEKLTVLEGLAEKDAADIGTELDALQKRMDALVAFVERTRGDLAELAADQVKIEARADALERRLDLHSDTGQTAKYVDTVIEAAAASLRDPMVALLERVTALEQWKEDRLFEQSKQECPLQNKMAALEKHVAEVRAELSVSDGMHYVADALRDMGKDLRKIREIQEAGP